MVWNHGGWNYPTNDPPKTTCSCSNLLPRFHLSLEKNDFPHTHTNHWEESKEVNLYYPIGSMYGIFTYIWLIFMVNVGKYAIHGSYGYDPFALLFLYSFTMSDVGAHPGYLPRYRFVGIGLPMSAWLFRPGNLIGESLKRKVRNFKSNTINSLK